MKVKLGDLTKIRTGKLDANAASDDGVYPFFTCSREPLKISSYSYECECVLVAGNGDLNVKYYNGKFDAYQRTYIIEAKKPDVLYMPYLYYFMEKYVVELRKLAIGGVIKYIKLGNLTDALIELPTYEKQQSLVERLEKVKSTINKRSEQLTKLDELVKCRFVEMFGNPIINERDWNYSPLPKLADFVLGSTPKSSEPEYWDGDIKWLTPAELEDTTFIVYDSVRHITEAGVKAAGLKPFPAGTVIFSTRAPIGKTAIAGCEMYCNQGFKNFICGPRLDPVYLFSVLRIYKDYFIDLGTGTTFKELSKARLEKISIAVPPMELQKVFEQFYRRVDKLRFVIQKSLDETQMLFDSLMQDYFD